MRLASNKNRSGVSGIVRFYVLAFLITWFFWFPLVLSNQGLITWRLPGSLFLAGAFGPVAAALIVSWTESRWTGIRDLLRRLIIWKLPLKWYLFSVLFPFLIVAAVLPGLYLIHGPIYLLEFREFGDLAAIFFSSLVVCANEELAWRGFTLPRMQAHFNAFHSSMIVGFFWGLIHLPLFFLQPERSGGFPLLLIIPLFILLCMFLSVIYTFLFNSTRGSVLTATLLHTSLNTANELYSSPSEDYDLSAMILFLGIIILSATFITVRFGTDQLSRHPRITYLSLSEGKY